ncbi:response regulator [Marinospirillum insulare]|uniref:Response regulatory domain-containing protein n=1 Tax=Marinospirillum insulare TaxID=217169 RepID=A0ABQ6A204_9GAMM|nr:response regulator [Marinospirillum insulare]GLR64597.1 hypothetical protein GCM10007878_20350 [Marinospirillum insulare]
MLSKDVVLVVDDSTTARSAIINVLRDHLYCKDIVEASDGQEALRRLKQRPDIDWIFCDWEMPVMAGDELLKEIRANPETAHLPFIMITSKGDRDSLVTAVQLGVTSFIVKPFTAKKLVEKVFMAQGRMERRNAERTRVSSEQKTTLKFSSGVETEASLVDISLSGLLMMVEHESVRNITVFDSFQAKVGHPHGKGSAILPCQVIRLEADPMHPSRTSTIRLAARFQPMEEGPRKHLVSYIEAAARQARASKNQDSVD